MTQSHNQRGRCKTKTCKRCGQTYIVNEITSQYHENCRRTYWDSKNHKRTPYKDYVQFCNICLKRHDGKCLNKKGKRVGRDVSIF